MQTRVPNVTVLVEKVCFFFLFLFSIRNKISCDLQAPRSYCSKPTHNSLTESCLVYLVGALRAAPFPSGALKRTCRLWPRSCIAEHVQRVRQARGCAAASALARATLNRSGLPSD